MRFQSSSAISQISALVVAALMAAQAAVAEERASRFDIPEQSLAQSLRDVGRVTNTNILFDPPRVKDLKAPAIKAEMKADEALRTLLQGTGIRFEFVNDETVVVGAGDAKLLRLSQADSGSGNEGVADSGSVKLEEVIVTAQKREERLHDVPISISVLSGIDLDKSRSEGVLEELAKVPGLATAATIQGGGTLLSIRGVASSGALFNGASPTGYYIDSVPFGFVKSSLVPDMNPYDLDRIEVLRGPQGTLYGANSLNGVVRVLTKDPELDAFDFKGRASTSSTKLGGANYRADAAVNLPIIPGKLAARAVVGYEDLSGWVDTPNRTNVNDVQSRNIRLKVAARPTDELSIGLSLWHTRSDFGTVSMSDDNNMRSTDGPEFLLNKLDIYALKLSYEMPAFTITSSTSYMKYGNASDIAIGSAPPYFIIDDTLRTRNLSEELILNSTASGAWRWSLGAFYRDAKDDLLQNFGSVDLFDKSRSSAVFGQATRLFIDGRFELTGGLRYFRDKVENGDNPNPFNPLPLVHADRTFEKVTPRIVGTWHPSADATVYASYSEGFRSGADQTSVLLRIVPDYVPVNPDSLRNYELGIKKSSVDGRVNLEGAVYYIDWRNVQQVVTVPSPDIPGVVYTALINAGTASGVGAELGLSVQPVRGLELEGSVSWCGLYADGQILAPGGGVLFNKGDRLAYSPKYTAAGSVNYAFKFENGYSARLGASANYTPSQSSRFIGGDNVPVIDDSSALFLASSSISIEAPSHWTLTGYVENLTNYRKAAASNFANPEWSGRMRPRTIGLQMEYQF